MSAKDPHQQSTRTHFRQLNLINTHCPLERHFRGFHFARTTLIGFLIVLRSESCVAKGIRANNTLPSSSRPLDIAFLPLCVLQIEFGNSPLPTKENATIKNYITPGGSVLPAVAIVQPSPPFNIERRRDPTEIFLTLLIRRFVGPITNIVACRDTLRFNYYLSTMITGHHTYSSPPHHCD